LEKKKIPRPKTCGGGVTHRARKLLAVDIGSVVEREFFSATITLLQSNLCFEARRDKPLIYMTTRAVLDRLLVQAAQNAGTEIREEAEVHSVSVGDNQVTLQTTSGSVNARFAIAADGVNSVVAKAAGWKESRLLAPAIEGELYLSDKEMTLFAKAARFDFDATPHGYAWLFPKKDHLSVGVLSIKRGKVALRRLFQQYLSSLGIREIKKKALNGAVIPLTPRKDGFSRDRVILVGDSAGFADPVTAEGIYFAVKSGQLAARALIASQCNVKRTVTSYEKLIHQTILPELTAARVLARVLYSPPKLRAWVFRRYGEKFANAVTDVIIGSRTYHETISNPKNYLKLLALRH
jgi:geranylgeranyl reductase family protein